VVDYTEGDTAAAIRAHAPDGVDIVVEVAPAQNLVLDLSVIRSRGTIAIYANNGGDEVPLSVRQTFSTNVRMQFVYLYLVGPDALANAAEDVTAAVREGALAVGEDRGLPLHHFPLEDTAAAHAAVEDGVVGKVLVDVGDL
jgi:NADPH2:quinone reductase